MEPGLRAEVGIVVGEGDTARALGSGDVPVLGTPRLLALAEAATVAAVRDHLEPGTTTVGTAVTIRHRAASPLGAEVTVAAELTEVDGGRLGFAVTATEPGTGRDIGGGTVRRVVVNRAEFVARAAGRPG